MMCAEVSRRSRSHVPKTCQTTPGALRLPVMTAALQAKLVVVVLCIVRIPARAQFSTTAPGVAQETRAHGYWADPSTGLTWAARDSSKRMGWHKATKYSRNLRLAGYSDWRLPSIDEL